MTMNLRPMKPKKIVPRTGTLLPKYEDGLRISQCQIIIKCLGRKAVNFGARMAFFYQAKCSCGALNEYTQDSIRSMIRLDRKSCKHCFQPKPRISKNPYTQLDLAAREDAKFLAKHWDPSSAKTAAFVVDAGLSDWKPR